MNFSKMLVMSRKIHRATLMATFILGAIMSATGAVLKFRLYSVFPYLLALNVHSFLAILFVVAFLATGISGLLMYFLPEIIRRKAAAS